MRHLLFHDRTARRWRSERGAALVEAALVLPLFALILAGTIDFGRVMYTLLAVLVITMRTHVDSPCPNSGTLLDLPGVCIKCERQRTKD